MQKELVVVVPAHNEEERIGRMLQNYCSFFSNQTNFDPLAYTILVVLNACTDDTKSVVQTFASEYQSVSFIELLQPGKGRAVRYGFEHALRDDPRVIGFVDADMATEPCELLRLYNLMEGYDGIVASRYSPGADIFPRRPWYKRVGSKLVYEPLVKLLLGIHYYDYQCGAKLFKASALRPLLHHLYVDGWTFDIELLYLLHKQRARIKEEPTRWRDRQGSKLHIFNFGSLEFVSSIFSIALKHAHTKLD